MPLLPYDYLHLVNCPEVVTISDNYCNDSNRAFSDIHPRPADPYGAKCVLRGKREWRRSANSGEISGDDDSGRAEEETPEIRRGRGRMKHRVVTVHIGYYDGYLVQSPHMDISIGRI